MSQYVPLFGVDELPEGEGRPWQVNDRRLAIFNVDGEFYAIDNTCPHAGAPLCAGHLEGTAVYCPMHLWRFDLVTGKCSDVPTASVRTYPLRVESGTLWVGVEPKSSEPLFDDNLTNDDLTNDDFTNDDFTNDDLTNDGPTNEATEKEGENDG